MSNSYTYPNIYHKNTINNPQWQAESINYLIILIGEASLNLPKNRTWYSLV